MPSKQIPEEEEKVPEQSKNLDFSTGQNNVSNKLKVPAANKRNSRSNSSASRGSQNSAGSKGSAASKGSAGSASKIPKSKGSKSVAKAKTGASKAKAAK